MLEKWRRAEARFGCSICLNSELGELTGKRLGLQVMTRPKLWGLVVAVAGAKRRFASWHDAEAGLRGLSQAATARFVRGLDFTIVRLYIKKTTEEFEIEEGCEPK